MKETCRSATGKDSSFRSAFPSYLFEPTNPEIGRLKYFFFRVLQLPIHALIWLALRPRREAVGVLDRDEVNSVYTRQARRYDATHHITTRGQDTNWRRMAGWVVANYRNSRHVKVLDLCTGTGLTILAIMQVLRDVPSAQKREIEIYGLDYNREMLEVARQNVTGVVESALRPSVHLITGDAADFCRSEPSLHANEMDVVTQIFGIGGIDNPTEVFKEVLAALKVGGQYLLVDMHRPIPGQPGEFPLLGWHRMPNFERFVYAHTTIPLALARLWGWRDTTADFYTAPLIAHEGAGGEYHGFRILWRQVESERWWGGLPVMPTARLLLEKERISAEEARYRSTLLSVLQEEF